MCKFNAEQILAREVIVEAENEKEAEERLKDALYYGKITFDTDKDFHDHRIEQKTGNGWPMEMDNDIKLTYTNYVDDYITSDGERL